MPKVKLVREGRTIEVAEGANLRLELLKAGVDVYRDVDTIANCRGNGLCGTCLVEVKPEDALTPVTVREKAKLWMYGERPLRYSCQSKVQGDCSVLSQPQLQQGWYSHPYYAHLKESVEGGAAREKA